jgi:hypothetical protein
MTYPEFHVEPNWKELATRYREERDAARKEVRDWKKQVAELTKKLGDQTADETPVWRIVSP